jgi:trigger factor
MRTIEQKDQMDSANGTIQTPNSVGSSALGATAESVNVEGMPFDSMEVTISVSQTVSDADVLQKLQDYKRLCAPVRFFKEDETVAMGDEVLLDTMGYVGGELIMVKTDTWMRIEPNSQLPGLFESLVNTPIGVPLMTPVSLPKNYSIPQLAGADAAFALLAKNGRKIDIESLKQDWWRILEKGDSLDAVKETIRQELECTLASNMVEEVGELVLNELSRQAPGVIPESKIEETLQEIWKKEQRPHYLRSGLSLHEQENAYAHFRTQDEPRSKARTKVWREAFLSNYVQAFNIQVQKRDVMKLLGQVGTTIGLRPTMIHDALSEDNSMAQSLEAAMLKQKAFEHILGRVQIHYKSNMPTP